MSFKVSMLSHAHKYLQAGANEQYNTAVVLSEVVDSLHPESNNSACSMWLDKRVPLEEADP
jgi:hypothetical protein